MNRLDDFFEETWQFYRKPLNNYTKTIVRRYDDYLVRKKIVREEIAKETKKIGLNKQIILPTYPPLPKEKPVFTKPKRIAFIHEDVGHITGGRYYTYFIISALLELGHEVTVYSNKKAVFSHEFDGYKKPNFKIVTQNASQLAMIKIPEADVFMGSPIHGAMSAIKNAQKYNKPCFVLIFDPFPMMNKFIGKRKYIGWQHLVKDLRESDTDVISLCNETSKYIYDWLKKTQDKVHPLYPCINSAELSKVKEQKREKYALFISRLTSHKRFQDVVIACKRANIKLKVISSINGINAQEVVKKQNANSLVEFHLRVNDKKKFEMIKQASVVINGSIFEGFGIYVAEAIACGTPFVGYDYITFREIRDYAGAKNIYLAKPKNIDNLTSKLKLAIKEENFQKPSNMFDFERMVERLSGI
jgi:glycosyltransferase involved in cell wall biosynthesis